LLYERKKNCASITDNCTKDAAAAAAAAATPASYARRDKPILAENHAVSDRPVSITGFGVKLRQTLRT